MKITMLRLCVLLNEMSIFYYDSYIYMNAIRNKTYFKLIGGFFLIEYTILHSTEINTFQDCLVFLNIY